MTPEQLKAMNELLKTDVKEKPETAAACVGCHATGYKQPGGYHPAAGSLKHAARAFVGCVPRPMRSWPPDGAADRLRGDLRIPVAGACCPTPLPAPR
ncbi:MAG: hypothetical protein E4H17_01425 [Gemmatimonadales bacterium]|nr:MAG: hypothetical protein E4H17_01425 [Gemmatimonadales bacterium]